MNGGDPTAPRRRRLTLRLFPDYSAPSPLWPSDSSLDANGDLTDLSIELSDSLTSELEQWVTFWQLRYHYADGWATDAECEKWQRDGDDILQQLRSELVDWADVEGWYGMYRTVGGDQPRSDRHRPAH